MTLESKDEDHYDAWLGSLYEQLDKLPDRAAIIVMLNDPKRSHLKP